jgi:virginiamycin B lyase
MPCLDATKAVVAAIFIAATTIVLAAAASAAEITVKAESVTYASQSYAVNGLQMTVWTKPVASGGATRIAAATGGVWFAEHDTGKIVRFTTTGSASVYTIPSPGISVRAVAPGNFNDVWFAGFNQGKVGRLTASGAFTLYSTRVSRNGATGMTVGADGNLWFATDAHGIGRTTRAGYTRFFPVTDNTDQPSTVSVAGDGNIWYVQRKGSELGRVTPSGIVAQFPAELPAFNGSFGVTTGPDGKIWFCDPSGKRIGRMNIDGSGIVYFAAGLSGSPVSIITGPDNHMYFGELEGRIGRISTAGVIKEYPIPGAAGTANFPVRGLAVGPYGNIWFVNDARSQVGLLRIATSGVDCIRNVWRDLEACGWPGAGNTGHPPDRTLTPTAGRRITADGAVIDGERITGGLFIAAKNVVVRNSWITKNGGGASATAVVFVEPGASATIENNTLDGTNSTHSAIWHEGAKVVARGNNMFGINDGVFVWDTDNFILEDNYLHDFTENAANGHIDGFQTEGASHGVIRHNTFDVSQDQTSAIAIWNGRRNSDDILVENNLIAGGGFSVYAEDYHPSEDNPAGGYSVTNIRIFNNKFSTVHYPCVGSYGVWFTRGAPTDGWRRLGNVVLETWQKLDTKNPVVSGWECR